MTSIQRKIIYGSKISSKISEYILSKFQFFLLSFYKEKNIVDLIKQIKTDVDFAVFPYEAYLIYSIARTQEGLEGDMAEIGVYQGGSAKLICEAKKKRNLFLFDTFEGLPDVSDVDTHFGKKFWKKNQFNNTSEQQIRIFLKDYDNVKIVKGVFPNSAEPIENAKFSFVHLDVDLYKSTIDCLRYFFPRMINGGIILIHDFHTDGIKKAIKEFSSENPIHIIDLNGTQGMILKC
jgi:O-methyltransferase